MEILDDKRRAWLESAKFVKAKPGVYVLYVRLPKFFYRITELLTIRIKCSPNEFIDKE